MSIAPIDRTLVKTRTKSGSQQPISPGQVISQRFIVGKLLGEGGMSRVFHAWDRWRRTFVALKIDLADPYALLAEGNTMECVNAGNPCPHIVKYGGWGCDGKEIYLHFEYVEGIPLDRYTPFDLPRALEITASICYGLRRVARQGIIHKDIKPSNVVLRRSDGAPVLIDFGLSKYPIPKGFFAGTFDYASPEQLRGEELDHRSDIYSLGVVLFEMVARRNTDLKGIRKILANRPDLGLPDVKFGSHPVDQAVGPSVQQLIKQMTADDKNDRPATYDVILAEIERIRTEISRVSEGLSALERQIPPLAPPPVENYPAETPTIELPQYC